MKIFITGVSKGLGFCLACEFLAAGHKVFGLARSDKEESASLKLLENNTDFVYYQVDWRVSKHLQKGLSLPFLFFDNRARL